MNELINKYWIEKGDPEIKGNKWVVHKVLAAGWVAKTKRSNTIQLLYRTTCDRKHIDLNARPEAADGKNILRLCRGSQEEHENGGGG